MEGRVFPYGSVAGAEPGGQQPAFVLPPPSDEGTQKDFVDLRGQLVGREDYAARALSAVRYIVIHHSGVAVDLSPLAIARYHVESLGWPGIGYHWMVGWDGTISYVGDMGTVRANVKGRNREVVGICLPGDFRSVLPRKDQLAGARTLLAHLREVLPGRELVGHRDIALDGTICPGDTWPDWGLGVGG